MGNLPLFNATGKCPKCGSGDVSTTHFAAGQRSWLNGRAYVDEYRERMERHCQRCHYHWSERPLHADKQSEGE